MIVLTFINLGRRLPGYLMRVRTSRRSDGSGSSAVRVWRPATAFPSGVDRLAGLLVRRVAGWPASFRPASALPRPALLTFTLGEAADWS